MFNDITFANKEVLYLLALIPIMAVVYIIFITRKNASVQVSTTRRFTYTGARTHLRHIPFLLRLLTVVGLVIALARPQSTEHWKDAQTQGIDIMLALDISTSMLAADFSPNRLEAAKDLAVQFISGRDYDRLGLVVFSGESFTQCPLTTNHASLVNLFREIETGMINADGTAIGMGLANAVNRLKDSDADSKVIILLTDGENNTGQISPLTAADIAKEYGIRLYTIGVGSKGTAPYPVQRFGRTYMQQIETDIDEPTLTQMAEMTGGKYFRATGNEQLKEIYGEIDQMEKSLIDVTQYSKKEERFMLFLLFAAAALFAEMLLRKTVFNTVS